jgi:vanillate monooxygenase ferredoxin subunit
MTEALIPVRVARKQALAEGISAFELVPAEGATLPVFEAGAHIDVHLARGEVRIVRPYSLCGVPGAADRWQIAVLREPASRGGSAAMHAWVFEGSTLAVSAPRNHFRLAPRAAHSLLLAGGIGITPLLAMAEQLHADGAAFELHHCTRTLARTPFRERLAAAPWADRVAHHLDDGPAAQRLDLPALLAVQPPGTQLYVCGPQGFMDAVLAAARAQGWPEAQLHWEAFHAEVAPQAGDQAFELQLARSGLVIRVDADQTAARALEAAGVFLPTSCEQGVCGTCLTRVLDGLPDHRDQYLSDEERAANDQFTPCCSRARSARLVIDL